MKLHFPALAATLIAAATLPLAASGWISISTEDGNGADAAIFGKGDRKDTNFGPAEGIPIKSIAYAPKVGYLRFDTAQLDGKSILRAALVLTTAGTHAAEQQIKAFGLLDADASAAWIEGHGVDDPDGESITWNNAPGLDPNSGQLDPSQFIELGEVEAGRDAFDGERSGSEITLETEELAAFLRDYASPTTTIVLIAANFHQPEDVVVASKENLKEPPPRLEVEVENP